MFFQKKENKRPSPIIESFNGKYVVKLPLLHPVYGIQHFLNRRDFGSQSTLDGVVKYCLFDSLEEAQRAAIIWMDFENMVKK